MTATTRTDRHRPSSETFDPQDYEFTGAVHDNQPDFPGTNNGFLAIRKQLLAEGYTFSGVHGGTGQCDHCGSFLRYSALMIHVPTRTLIYIGETCLGNRFEMTKGAFDTMRKNAQLAREQQVRKVAFQTLCDENPDLVWATYAWNIGAAVTSNGQRWEDRFRKSWGISTLRDIANKAYRYGKPTRKQLDLVTKIVRELERAEGVQAVKDAKRAAERAARPNAAIGEVGDRREFEGTVRWFDHYENDYDSYGGMNTVMIIDTAEGTVKWKASKFIGLTKGQQIKIKATVKDHEIYTPDGGGEADAQITTVITRGKIQG